MSSVERRLAKVIVKDCGLPMRPVLNLVRLVDMGITYDEFCKYFGWLVNLWGYPARKVSKADVLVVECHADQVQAFARSVNDAADDLNKANASLYAAIQNLEARSA